MNTPWIERAHVRSILFGAVVAATAGGGLAVNQGVGTTAHAAAHPGMSLVSAHVAPSSTGGSAPRRFAPLYMGKPQKYTQAQAVAMAQDFDVISVQGNVFTPYLSAMRAANPSLKIVAYLNGAFDQSSGGTSYPSSWYARDAKGNRIQSVNYGNWLMDPTNASWHQTVAAQCTSQVNATRYDGCFLDTLGLGPLMPGYVTSLPVDQSTHKVFTPSVWLTAQCATVTAVQHVSPNGLVVTNGLADGAKYFAGGGAATEVLLATSHTAMSELWLRVSHNPVNAYPSVTAWKQDVDMLVNAESHGWSVLTTTKLWVGASAAQQDGWHKFTLASFLLGAGSHCAYSFSTGYTAAELAATSPYDTVAVGSPTGAYVAHGSYYERSFSNGVALVNPSGSSVTVSLSTTYKNLDGSQVRSETLPPHSGDVLVNG